MGSTEAIEAIIYKTYGRGAYSESLVKHLAEKIADDAWGSRGREHTIMLICWDWMTGGSTAESVARQIELALTEAQ
jgi:hypothetical protein